MITFHAKDKSISEIVDWFEAGLTENGWKESGTPSKSETRRFWPTIRMDENAVLA